MPRYTIDFNEEFDNLLKEIAEKKGVTKAEVIRRSVASYSYLEKQTADQNKLSITDNEDKVIKDIKLP
jgi:predicted transcriptional regulator